MKRRYIDIPGWRQPNATEKELRHPAQTYKFPRPPFIRHYASLFDPRHRPQGFDHLTDAERFQFLAVMVAYSQSDVLNEDIEADPEAIRRLCGLESAPPLDKFHALDLIRVYAMDNETGEVDEVVDSQSLKVPEQQSYRDQSYRVQSTEYKGAVPTPPHLDGKISAPLPYVSLPPDSLSSSDANRNTPHPLNSETLPSALDSESLETGTAQKKGIDPHVSQIASPARADNPVRFSFKVSDGVYEIRESMTLDCVVEYPNIDVRKEIGKLEIWARGQDLSGWTVANAGSKLAPLLKKKNARPPHENRI